MVQYFSLISSLSIVSAIIQTPDGTFFTSLQLIYRNFAYILHITTFMGLSIPLPSLSKYLPASNFMGL